MEPVPVGAAAAAVRASGGGRTGNAGGRLSVSHSLSLSVPAAAPHRRRSEEEGGGEQQFQGFRLRGR